MALVPTIRWLKIFVVIICSLISADYMMKHVVMDFALRNMHWNTNVEDRNISDSHHKKSLSAQHTLRATSKIMHYQNGKDNIFDGKRDSNVTKVLLFASFRGGSTFGSDFFRKIKNSFYSFEPLYFLNTTTGVNIDNDPLIKRLKMSDIVELLRLIFDCKLRQAYIVCMRYHREATCQRWSSVALGAYSTLDLILRETKCRKATLVTIKVIRAYYLEQVAPLVDYGVKIVHLVRDPRGTISSRLTSLSKRKKVYSKDIRSKRSTEKIKDLCEPSAHNLRFISDMKKNNSLLLNSTDYIYSPSNASSVISRWPSHYMLVRYEDLTRNPMGEAWSIYKFVGINFPKEIIDWVEQSRSMVVSEATQHNAMSTIRRNWTENAFRWKKAFEISVVTKIQDLCEKSMSSLGYDFIETSEQLSSPHNNVLSPLES